MGVTGLWSIVTPLSKVLPLSELHGKTVAIDLSCWIVDSQTVGSNDGCPKKHLRNIFFRTVALLLNGILPVFVLEGEAPKLKYSVIRQRNEVRKDCRFKSYKNQKQKKNAGRSNAFNATVKECEMMLGFIGLKCIRADGEAEAMCAYLNADGLVDGCITQDSDCFLYGAKTIFRNFNLTDRSGFGCAVEEYSLEKIQNVYNFGRNKMIALALLCGCDYDNGVPGIGKDGAVKWLQSVEDAHVLNIFEKWRNDRTFDYSVDSRKKSDINKLIPHEYQIRKKCLAVKDFPKQDLINEFIHRKGIVPDKIDGWNKPDAILLVEFLRDKLKWKIDYTIEKVIPILTRWNVEHLTNIDLKAVDLSSLIIPKRIIKLRNLHSVTYYEIEWSICSEQIDLSDLTNEENESGLIQNLSTVEPRELVNKAYPELVKTFEELKNISKKKLNKKQRARKIDDQNDKKIDQFFKSKRISKNKSRIELKSPLISSTQRKKTERIRHSSSQIHQKSTPNLHNTTRHINETLAEEDFLTDMEEDTLEMSLVIARLCESADNENISDKSLFTRVNLKNKNDIISQLSTETTKCNNSDNDDFNDDIIYVPLDVRVRK